MTKRRKFPCKECPAVVTYLPRHMRDMHSSAENEAHHVTLNENLRVKRQSTNRETEAKGLSPKEEMSRR